jgi:hypothetical protein
VGISFYTMLFFPRPSLLSFRQVDQHETAKGGRARLSRRQTKNQKSTTKRGQQHNRQTKKRRHEVMRARGGDKVQPLTQRHPWARRAPQNHVQGKPSKKTVSHGHRA